VRPYAYQSFQAFEASLLCRPEIEEMIDRAWDSSRDNDDIGDIWGGSAVHDLEGPDKKRFGDRPAGEARLVWSISIDWFNPYHNKIAGKSASVGSMVMSCLNLPPSIRNKPENLYLNIIPGPQEPHVDEVNHFLRPLVDDLLPSWKTGTWYTRTHRYMNGRRASSAVCTLVADLPGARKAAGGMGHRGNFISPFYSEQRKKDINNIQEEVSTS
jgi:hypothetical protein